MNDRVFTKEAGNAWRQRAAARRLASTYQGRFVRKGAETCESEEDKNRILKNEGDMSSSYPADMMTLVRTFISLFKNLK